MLNGRASTGRIVLAVCAAVLLAAGAGCSPGSVPAPSASTSMDRLRMDLEQFSKDRLAGGASAVLLEARLDGDTWSSAAGVRDLETQTPAEPADSFHIASLTKSMVAASVLKLVEQGKVRLDGRISEYLPELNKSLRPPQPLTVRMLLEHTSGMPNFEEALIRSGPLKQVLTTPLTPTQRIELASTLPWNTDDVGVFRYSSSNFVVLGLLIERVTGHSLGEVLQADIADPLGLSGTLLTGTGTAPQNIVHGYVVIEGERVDAARAGVQSQSASGGVISTAPDVSDFYAALLDGKLVGKDLVEEMQGPDAPDYGLGLAKWRDSCAEDYYYGHLGGAPGYASVAMISADRSRQLTLFLALAEEPLSAEAPPPDYGLVEFARQALDRACR